MRYCFFLLCLFLCRTSAAQTAKQIIRKMEQVHFEQPVKVLFRLDRPIRNAEYSLIIEESLIPHLDTLSFSAMLNHPGIYFSQAYSSSVKGSPRGKYYLDNPELPDGLDPFKAGKFPYERLARPPKGRLYTRKEPAMYYSKWFVRKDSSDPGINDKINTLPGVDSVRVIYTITVRKGWRFKPTKGQIK